MLIDTPSLASACPQKDTPWATYASPNDYFTISYPRTANLIYTYDATPQLLSRLTIEFIDHFDYSRNNGILRFGVQVSIWSNTNNLSAEDWAKTTVSPMLSKTVLKADLIYIGSQPAYRLHRTDLTTYFSDVFIAKNHLMYELYYQDIDSNTLVPACWKSVQQAVVTSFRPR